MRPSKERIEEIRKWANLDLGSQHPVNDLLAHIDALEADNKCYSELCYTIEKQRDQLKAENERLKKDLNMSYYQLSGRSKEHFKHLDDKLKLKDGIKRLCARIDALEAENELLKTKVSHMHGAQEVQKLREENEKLKTNDFGAYARLEEENQKLRDIGKSQQETINNFLSKNEKLRARVENLRDVITWVRDGCGYASPWWIKMNEALKVDDSADEESK